jgi:MFS family permease
MFIVFRAFSAIGSSSAMSMGAGTIADIFEPHERGRAFAYYTCGPLLGPAIGPIIGGYLNQGLGWRSNFWFLSIFCFLTWLGIVFFLPETWRASPSVPPATVDPLKDHHEKKPSVTGSSSSSSSTTSTKQDENIEIQAKEDMEIKQQQKKKKARRAVNPIGALRLLKFPNIALAVTFVGVLFFVLYLNNTNFTRIYTVQYGFDSGIVGLCYLPNAAGSMIGGIAGGRMSDKIYNRRVAKAREHELEIYPEMRLGGPLFYASVVLQLFAFIAYGWCIQEDVHFAYGLVCQFFSKWL